MKLYKYWKIYLGIGIFFALSVFANISKISLNIVPNIIFTILFLFLGITQRKKAYSNPEYTEEMNQHKQERELARLPHQEKYKDLTKIHTKIAGVTFKNDNGSSRQEYLTYVKNNDQLFLQEYSYKGKPAFYICNKNKQCLGNLPQEIADKIKKKYDTNNKLVFVEDIHSFDRNEYDAEENNKPDYIYTCNIVIYIQ